MTVDLGGFTFDPTETTDFRMGVEGASKTGKSNTLAVINEDLAESPEQLPTLIIERLGILTSLRQEDDNLIVAGAPGSGGIDLEIPLNQVDMVAELVLDEGLKVLLDISTYSTDDVDGSAEHRAASRALKAMNDAAGDRLRSGNRRHALIEVDEVHVLAPENGAPHINLNDDVRRCRAQLVTLATEGGNKGLSLICAYQRRAYTTKGVISQLDNYVVHRLHASDRDDVASEIGVDETEIEELGTGEVLIYGDITRQRVEGPLKVRPRRSPDPRQDQFDVAQPSGDLEDVLAEIQGEIEAEEQQRSREESRIEELENEIERLENRNQELREEARVAEAIRRGVEGDAEGVPRELEERIERLEQQVRERDDQIEKLEQERSELQDQVEDQRREIEDLETELAEARELEAVRDDVASSARSILRAVGAEDLEDVELEDELERLREENQRLLDRVDELENQDSPAGSGGGGVLEQLEHAAIRRVVDQAADGESIQRKHFDRVLQVMAASDDNYLTRQEIAPLTDITASTVGEVLNALHTTGLVQREGTSAKGYRWQLNHELIEQRIDVEDRLVVDEQGGDAA